MTTFCVDESKVKQFNTEEDFIEGELDQTIANALNQKDVPDPVWVMAGTRDGTVHYLTYKGGICPGIVLPMGSEKKAFLYSAISVPSYCVWYFKGVGYCYPNVSNRPCTPCPG